MSEFILNIINQILCYSDGVVTDNPHQRAIDHRRRMESLPVKNPYQSNFSLRPGQSFKIFENQISAGLDSATELQIKVASQTDSVYKISIVSGAGSFKTAKAVTGLADCSIAINNGAMAVFDFGAADLSAVQVGDIMRIKGDKTYDAGPFAFNPLNSGNWIVIGKSGSKLSATRKVAQLFEGITENVTSISADVEFFADDKLVAGNKISISEDFSPASFGVYEIADVTPTTIYFTSGKPLPEEDSVVNQNSGIIFYTSTKKLVYIESDQEVVVRFDGDTGNSNKVAPIKAGDRTLVGFMQKWGDSYSCEIVNKSVTTCNIKYFTCE